MPGSAEALTVDAVSVLGRFAAKALAPGAHGRVLAVFERSFYVDMGDGRLACVGFAALGAGPLNALTENPPRLPGPHDPVIVDGESVRIGTGPRLGLAGAVVWMPPPMPAEPPTELGNLRQALAQAPAESLASIVLEQPSTDRVVAAAQLGLRALNRWLRTGSQAAPPEAMESLIGLGNGLTPSGDDALAGAMVALRAWGRGEVADGLARWLIPRTLGRTNDISRAHIAAAAAGEGHEHLHGLLVTLGLGDSEAVSGAAARLGALGHTSGWDALAGVAVASGVLPQAP